MLVTSMKKQTVTIEAEKDEKLQLGSDGYCISSIVLECPEGDQLREKLTKVFECLLDISDEHENFKSLREERTKLLNELLKYPVFMKTMVFVGVPKKVAAEQWLSKSVSRLTCNDKVVRYLYEIEKIIIGKDIVIDHLTTDETLKKIESDLLKNVDHNVIIVDLSEWLEGERDICFENYNQRQHDAISTGTCGL
jgi:hypothetical protein